MAIWDDVVPREEQDLYTRAGMGGRIGWGDRPGLLIVDMTYGFVDSAYPLGCSETGWPAARAIQGVLERARRARLPIVFSVARQGRTPMEAGRWKGGGAAGDPAMRGGRANAVVDVIAPGPDDVVIDKAMPSAFFGTHLASFLAYARVDTIILAGMVTSGCVRATALDAFSYNYRVIIPQECVADRGQTSHKVALFDLHMKYADVLPVADVTAHLDALAGTDAGPPRHRGEAAGR